MENLIDLLRHMNKKIDELIAEILTEKEPLSGLISLTTIELDEHMKALRAWQVIFNNHERIKKAPPPGVIDRNKIPVSGESTWRLDWRYTTPIEPMPWEQE